MVKHIEFKDGYQSIEIEVGEIDEEGFVGMIHGHDDKAPVLDIGINLVDVDTLYKFLGAYLDQHRHKQFRSNA